MTTFGWKRKAGENVSKSAASKFQQESERDKDGEEVLSHWLQVAKQRKVILLEDAKTKSERLKEEGSILAEAQRYWEAIKKWDEALQLTPGNEQILDMKAQALLILHEIFPAVESAELAVKFNRRWWAAYQTLGRAQLGLGEIQLAVKSFSKAIHLNPSERELWEEDLRWTRSLLQEKHMMEREGPSQQDKEASVCLETDGKQTVCEEEILDLRKTSEVCVNEDYKGTEKADETSVIQEINSENVSCSDEVKTCQKRTTEKMVQQGCSQEEQTCHKQ